MAGRLLGRAIRAGTGPELLGLGLGPETRARARTRSWIRRQGLGIELLGLGVGSEGLELGLGLRLRPVEWLLYHVICIGRR